MSEIRFADASQDIYKLMNKIIKQRFKELINAKILILMDMKKRISGEKIIFARISKTNDLIRHLTIEESGSETGYDYVMYIDDLMWKNLEEADKERVIRHELRHTNVDESSGAYGLRGHTIEDFHSEIELNHDDPRWRDRVAEVLMSRYATIKMPKPKELLDNINTNKK